ncbi:MAG: hypothetical protein IJ400_04920 [Clostridia bacterium]|nr:hypothetical protein [Clostridia bacterium]
MKKFNHRYLLISVLILLATLLLCSCNSFEKQLENMTEEEQAEAIIEKALLDLENASSYRSSTSTSLEFSYIKHISISVNSNNVLFAKGTDDHYQYTETVLESNDTTETYIEGYSNGKMFMSDGKTKVYSSLPINEYLDHLELISSLDDTSHLNDPTKITCKKRSSEDCYRIKASGFDEEAIEYICTEVLTGLPLIYKDSFAVSDIIISINVGLDFKLKDISFALEHEPLISSYITAPVFEMSTTFEELGEVEEDSLNKISLDDYTDALDLRLLDLARIDAEKALDSDCMDFTSAYTTSTVINGSTMPYTQTYTGRLDYYKRGLEFEAIQGSSSYIYRKGELSVNDGVGEELSEYEAKETLKGIILPITFSIDGLTKCEVVEKDNTKTYTLTYKKIDESLTTGLGVTIDNQKGKIIVTLTDGVVTSYTYESSGIVRNAGSIFIGVESTFEYYE